MQLQPSRPGTCAHGGSKLECSLTDSACTILLPRRVQGKLSEQQQQADALTVCLHRSMRSGLQFQTKQERYLPVLWVRSQAAAVGAEASG